jgi:hypothetical protein
MFCQYCNKELKSKNALNQHEIRCPSNLNRTITNHKWTDEQKRNWSKKCIETKCNNKPWTDEQKAKASITSKEANKKYWTAEKRLEQSLRMKKIVAENPDSYTKNNVSGRVKMYEVMSATGLTKVKGQWELDVANWLNENNIKWTNDIQPYNYFWNESWHLYFPDFLLIDNNVLIEVKGYETDRDRAKWQSVKDKRFVVLKEQQIKSLTQSMEEVIRSVS